MNKAIGIGIGVVVVAIAVGILGGSTFFSDSIENSIPTDDSNQMTMGDKISVTVTPTESVSEEENDETEGNTHQVNIIDGVTATSTP